MIPISHYDKILRLSEAGDGIKGFDIKDINNIEDEKVKDQYQLFMKNVEIQDIFFANGVIFVEGLVEWLLYNKLDKSPVLDFIIAKNGWVVINLEGKNNLTKGVIIADMLQVPWIAIMDFDAFITNDNDKKSKKVSENSIGNTIKFLSKRNDNIKLNSSWDSKMRVFEEEMIKKNTKDQLRDGIREQYGIYVLRENGIEDEVTKELQVKMTKKDVKSKKIREVVAATNKSCENGRKNSFTEIVEFIKKQIQAGK